MGRKETTYLLIEKYLANRLKGDELSDFEKELDKNTELRNEVALHKEIAQAVTEKDVINFRNLVQYALKNKASNNRRRAAIQWRYVGIAAAISIILVIAIVIMSPILFKKKSTEQLYITYYEPYEDLISGRSNEADNANVVLALVYYNQKEYSKVIKQLNTINIRNKPLLQLYAGISYLNINDFKKAHSTFESIITGNNLFQVEALWYNALTYLKEGNTKKSKLILKKIIATPNKSSYAQKAKRLLEEL